MADPIIAEPVVTEDESLAAGYKTVKEGISNAAPVTNAEPAVVAVPVTNAEPPVVEPAVVEPVDPWKDVPGVVKESHEAVARQLGTFSKEFNEHRANFGRIAASLQRLEAGKAAAAAVPVALAPTAEQIAEAAKSVEKWNKQKEEFPEWAEATDERFAAERAAILKLIPPKAEPVDTNALRAQWSTETAQAVQHAERRARSFARVDAKHETWEDDILSPNGGYTAEFAAWNAVQLPEMQALAASEKPQDAIKMLDAFYAHRTAGETRQKNQTRLAAAVVEKQAPSSGPTILSDDASLLAGYNRVKHA